jgi:SAM-dependent methyltransferase
MKCLFCAGDSIVFQYGNLYHPLANDHGPFSFYRCSNCGSGLTYPLPSSTQLTSLYTRFSDGIMPGIREIRERFPLTVWYRQCMQRALIQSRKNYNSTSEFSWIDMGAGKGELSAMLAKTFPLSKGLALDFHQLNFPGHDLPNVTYQSVDLNDEAFVKNLPLEKVDLIFVITVLEHLRRPDIFLAQAVTLLKPGGYLYLTTPRFDSIASRLMGKSWPYFIPGEHLNIPSLRGMNILLQRVCSEKYHLNNCIVSSDPTILPYPAGYYLKYFKLGSLDRRVPQSWIWRIPTGMLEASVEIGNNN